MKPRLTIVLALIVLTPLAITGWLGARLVRDQQAVVEHSFRELMLGQLRSVDALLGRSLEQYEELVRGEMSPLTVNAQELRRRTRQSPYALQYYALDVDGRVVFPPVQEPSALTAGERESYERTRHIWDGGELSGSAGDAETSTSGSPTGWHAWYGADGLRMMVWERAEGRVHAAEINSTRLLAELVASLPETDALSPEVAQGRIRLVDSTGRLFYQWGSYEPEEGALPIAALALGAPLGAWSLEYFGSSAAFGGAAEAHLLLNLGLGLGLLGATVIGLTYYFYREQSREMREAAQRVSFVNQVSHELKTPLTNIRMYAELLEKDADEADERLQRYAGVIVSESQRLSRLIGNVLTFSRKQRRNLELHRTPGVVDDVLRQVLDHFRPALEAKGIEVELALDASDTVSLDADVLEQIVGNLISNVEKYGAGGKYLLLSSRRRGDTTEIVTADRGPGVPSRERSKIFEPFYRVSAALTEGVSGTGIGLAIARELARLHGGDLTLEPTDKGARFRVTIHCPAESQPG